jgi:hypothetical protein
MISREVLIGGSVALAALLAGGVALAASSSKAAAAPAAGGQSFAFAVGQRYKITFAIPAGAAPQSPTAAAAQSALDALGSGAFSVVSAGVSIPLGSTLSGPVSVFFLVDARRASTLTAAQLLDATPAGTTVTVDPQGASPVSAALPPGALGITSSSTSPGGITPTSATSVVGGPTSSGWKTSIALGPGSVTVSAWPGDTLSVQLPPGASWAAQAGLPASLGFPSSGSAPYAFQVTPSTTALTLPLAWTLGGVAYSTAISLVIGRSFVPATSWATNDLVWISLTQPNFTALSAAVGADAAELAALTAESQALQTSGVNVSLYTAAQSFALFLQSPQAPWTQLLSVSQLKVWGPGDTPPADWPTADTAGMLRAEFVYTGPGVAVSALPFPLTSWVRLT